MPDEKYFKALDVVLNKKYPLYSYSLNGYQEESVCLEKIDDKWVVFMGERGNRYDEEFCNTPLLACITMIRYLTHNQEEIRNMEEEFLSIL